MRIILSVVLLALLTCSALGDEYTIIRTRRHVTAAQKNAVFEKAHIPPEKRGFYVIDHIVPLELGGTNETSNLKAQRRTTAAKKDRVENYLAKQVARHEITVAEAQREILHWRQVQKRDRAAPR